VPVVTGANSALNGLLIAFGNQYGVTSNAYKNLIYDLDISDQAWSTVLTPPSTLFQPAPQTEAVSTHTGVSALIHIAVS
jgi:hypothetical protein